MSKKSKIAFVIASLNAGGAERVLTNIANDLVKSFDVTIILLHKCTPFYELDKNISITYCLESYNPNPNILQSLKNHFLIFYSVLKILKKNKIDVGIGFMTTSNIHLAMASKVNGNPCIISERIHPEHHHLGRFWQILRNISYPFAKILVVQTESIKKYFEAFVKSDKIEVIKNPLSIQLMDKRENYVNRKNIILNVGRLDDQKHQELLIRAFSNLNNENWEVILVGEGQLRKEYENLIFTLGLEQKISLVGNVTNIEDYYNIASIFVFTSRYEGFPNALTEAIYFGLPCISTDCPTGPSEIIESGKNGFLIPVGDQDELENKLKSLISDENLRQEFSRKGIESSNDFHPQVINTIWKSLINKIIN